jgi:hypothetical protein
MAFSFKDEVREKLGDFLKACIYFNVSFIAASCLPTFHKANMLNNDLKNNAANKFGIFKILL